MPATNIFTAGLQDFEKRIALAVLNPPVDDVPADVKFLANRHPVWLKQWELWEKRIRFYFDDDIEKEEGKALFLTRGRDEAVDLYRDRVAISEVVSESAKAHNKMTDTVFTEEITRSWKLNKDLDALQSNVDGQFTTASEFMKSVSPYVIALGVYHVLIDKPKLPAKDESIGGKIVRVVKEFVTAEDERNAGVRNPFWLKISPTEVVNWALDEQNLLMWVMIRMERSRIDEEGKSHKVIEYTKWNRDKWERWELEKSTENNAEKKLQVVRKSNGVHALGIVPLVPIYFRRTKTPMVGKGLSADAYRADLMKVRAESDQQWDAHVHAHPTLVVVSDRDMGEIGVGTNNYIKLGKMETAEYIAMPDSAFAALSKIITGLEEKIARHQGQDPLGVLVSKPAQATGIARAWSFLTSEEMQLVNLAKGMSAGERGIWEVSSRWLETDTHGPQWQVFHAINGGIIEYPSKFMITQPKEMLEEFTGVRNQIQSPTFLRNLAKRIVIAYARNVDENELKKIMEEVDALDFGAKPGFDETMPPVNVDDEEGNAEGNDEDGNPGHKEEEES